MKELEQLQSDRVGAEQGEEAPDLSDAAPFASEAEFFAALDAGYIPPALARNGFVFSTDAGNTPTPSLRPQTQHRVEKL
jgi:hypothetical protein